VTLNIRPAERMDVPLVADLIRQLAKFEKLEHEVVLTDELLVAGLFGPRPYAEAVIAEETVDRLRPLLPHVLDLSGPPRIYLEDLFVLPDHRGRGVGRALLAILPPRAERGWALGMGGSIGTRGDPFLSRLGARPN
jgi:GNAT superfamily N-acetyltransferase